MGSASSVLIDNGSEVDGTRYAHPSTDSDISFEVAVFWSKEDSQDDEELDLAVALSASLAQQTISDLPPDERPLTEPSECIACLETLSPSSFPSESITSACDHSARGNVDKRICTTCLSHHLDVQLNESGPNHLTCPICLALMTYSDVRKWASQRTFSRYDSLKTRAAVSSDPNFIWCRNPRCGSGQMHTSGPSSPIVICQACGTRACFNHPNAEWHEGLTCHEFDHPEAAEERRRREAEELEALARQQQEEEDRIRRRIQEDEKKEKASKRPRQQQEAERNRQVEEARRQKAREEEQTQRRKQREEETRQARAKEAERARRRNEEQKGEAEVLRTSKLCPGKGCSYRIYKIDGCKHMTYAVTNGVGSVINLGEAAI
ncbi:hypothetical protein VTN00DRAFT_6818 [Thermoascus crustaceus]|uniref:uncharacterized protein n=1 Tax=Thermoascus crustaceus TaxID=5088 RepID=UPI0037428DB1